VAFALKHDDGHIAPGSHLAHKVWFEGKPDCHEEMSHRLLKQDEGLRTALEHVLGVDGAKKLDLVVEEDPQVPPWTWQLVTAGGWNADRGDWVRRDSHMCGVTYGAYEIPIIKKNLTISPEGELVIRETGVSALEAFFGARADMYRSIYHHPVCRVGEKMHTLLGRRARDLFDNGELNFADDTMRAVLSAPSGADLKVATMMNMVEAWWQYHLTQWERSEDRTLRELSGRVLRRDPFKRFTHTPEVETELRNRARKLALDPDYFVVPIPPSEVNLHKDLTAAIKVQRTDGAVVPLTEYSSLMNALSELGSLKGRGFLAAPQDLLFDFKAH
jgi:HD superfamily phosphohydrolase